MVPEHASTQAVSAPRYSPRSHLTASQEPRNPLQHFRAQQRRRERRVATNEAATAQSAPAGSVQPCFLTGTKHPDAEPTGWTAGSDTRRARTLALAVGTDPKAPGAKRLVGERRRATRARGGRSRQEVLQGRASSTDGFPGSTSAPPRPSWDDAPTPVRTSESGTAGSETTETLRRSRAESFGSTDRCFEKGARTCRVRDEGRDAVGKTVGESAGPAARRGLPEERLASPPPSVACQGPPRTT